MPLDGFTRRKDLIDPISSQVTGSAALETPLSPVNRDCALFSQIQAKGRQFPGIHLKGLLTVMADLPDQALSQDTHQGRLGQKVWNTQIQQPCDR